MGRSAVCGHGFGGHLRRTALDDANDGSVGVATRKNHELLADAEIVNEAALPGGEDLLGQLRKMAKEPQETESLPESQAEETWAERSCDLQHTRGEFFEHSRSP